MRLPLRVLATCAAGIASAQYTPDARLEQIQMQPAAPNVQAGNTVTLSDILGGQRSISIFASWTRDVSSVSSRLESQGTNTTLLAPSNSALTALPRKPWEDPKDYAELGANAYEGNKGSERAAHNLERFVQAHIIPNSPWAEGEKVKTLAGGELWWEVEDGTTYVMPGKVEVDRVAKQVGNGEVWVLQGVVNYA